MIPIAKPYIGEEEINAVVTVLRSGTIAQGPKVRELEEKFAKFCGTKYAIAVNSGTAALHSSLYVTGIKENDEVITTPFTFIATANSILMQRARPVFADIDEETFNLDPEKIKQKVTKKTKAIMAVNLYGQACDYDALRDISKSKNLKIIEDAAQSVGAEYKGIKSGNLGDIAGFSFYATKNIACGEGGIITTNDEDYAENAKLFRQHGRSKMSAYEYVNLGYNYRSTDISAVIMLEQLKKLDFINKKRIENASYLSKGLQKIKGLQVPIVKSGRKHVYHQYTIRINGFKLSRDKLAEHLTEKGIGNGVYYPKPLHVLDHYKVFGYKKGDFPVAEKACDEVLSLPVHPHLTKDQMDLIINTIAELE